MTDHLTDIFDVQRTFQNMLGYDFEQMTTKEKVEYVRTYVLAGVAELIEALDETSWKPWSHGDPWIDEEALGKEMIDVMHFAVNVFLAAGWDADRVHERFLAKNQINRDRQAQKYDGVSTKCANRECRRAMDDQVEQYLVILGNERFNGLIWCNEACYDAWSAARVDLPE